MPHEITEPRLAQQKINRAHNRLDNLVTFHADDLDGYRVRALAPAGASYPRAAVVHELNGKWAIRIKNTPVHWHGDYILDLDGKPLTFDLQRGAIIHAANSVHALRARRHPAGQPWLRSSADSEVQA